MNTRQAKLILQLQQACEAIGMPIWLESGWAVDARLGTITREHSDIDLAVPAERMADFIKLLDERGAGPLETTEYGFLVYVDDSLLDCEPCHLVDNAYELEGVPHGSCPADKEGSIDGVPVRCTSWQAIVWEYFYYLHEVPYTDWPAKDGESYRLIRTVVGESLVEAWHRSFLENESRGTVEPDS